MKNLFWIVILFSSCGVQPKKELHSYKKYDITLNGELIESRYLNNSYKTVGIVSYDSLTKKPLDSVGIDYAASGNVNYIKNFNYSLSGFTAKDNVVLEKYYSRIYDYHNGNPLFLGTINDKLIEEDVSSLYEILYNDNLHSETITNGNSITYQYSGINAVFRELPEFVQACFYQQHLDRLIFVKQKDKIRKIIFYFKQGDVDVEYHYKNDIINRKIVKCSYNKDTFNSSYVWEYSYTAEPEAGTGQTYHRRN